MLIQFRALTQAMINDLCKALFWFLFSLFSYSIYPCLSNVYTNMFNIYFACICFSKCINLCICILMYLNDTVLYMIDLLSIFLKIFMVFLFTSNSLFQHCRVFHGLHLLCSFRSSSKTFLGCLKISITINAAAMNISIHISLVTCAIIL